MAKVTQLGRARTGFGLRYLKAKAKPVTPLLPELLVLIREGPFTQNLSHVVKFKERMPLQSPILLVRKLIRTFGSNVLVLLGKKRCVRVQNWQRTSPHQQLHENVKSSHVLEKPCPGEITH